MAHQDYFTHFGPCQSLRDAKTGNLRDKPPDHMLEELALSNIRHEPG